MYLFIGIIPYLFLFVIKHYSFALRNKFYLRLFAKKNLSNKILISNENYEDEDVSPDIVCDRVNNEEVVVNKKILSKGMLTGPATILNWSFVRDDIKDYENGLLIIVA